MSKKLENKKRDILNDIARTQSRLDYVHQLRRNVESRAMVILNDCLELKRELYAIESAINEVNKRVKS